MSAFALAIAARICVDLFEFFSANFVVVCNKIIAMALAIGVGILIIYFWDKHRKAVLYLFTIVVYVVVFFAGDAIISNVMVFFMVEPAIPCAIFITVDSIRFLFGKSNCISDDSAVYDVLCFIGVVYHLIILASFIFFI